MQIDFETSEGHMVSEKAVNKIFLQACDDSSTICLTFYSFLRPYECFLILSAAPQIELIVSVASCKAVPCLDAM